MNYLFLISSLLLFHLARGANECRVEGVDSWYRSYENPLRISDTHEGEVASLLGEDLINVFVKDVKYLDVLLIDNRVSIFTTEEYKRVEEQESYSYWPQISTEIVFECTNGSSTLNFIQKINDTNNHNPFFSKEQYIFLFGMDIASGVQITALQDVIATDIDLSNALIQFSVQENDYISIRAGGNSQSSTYALIETITDMHLPFEANIIITATDSEDPVRNGTAVIKILLIAPEDIVPNPIFSKSMYLANYSNGNLIFENDIALSHGYGYDLNIIQRGYEENFQVTVIDEDKGVFSVDLIKSLEENVFKYEKYITFEIQAHNVGAMQFGRCTIMVMLQT